MAAMMEAYLSGVCVQGGRSATCDPTPPPHFFVVAPQNETHLSLLNKASKGRGAWVAQSVKRQTSAQVMISRPTLAQVMLLQFMGSSPASGSLLTPGSLEPGLDSVPPSLSALPRSHSVSVKNK